MKKIVSFFGEKSEVFENLNDKAKQYALSKGIDYTWHPIMSFHPDEVAKILKGYNGAIIDVDIYDEKIFSQISGKANILVRFGVGYDKVDLKSASKHGIAIARTTAANTLGVAEMALTLILASKRKIKENMKCVSDCDWKKIVVNETIFSTVGIVGFGSIGKALNRLLAGFDCKVIAYDPFASKDDMAKLGVEKVELKELFKQSDAISLHLPYSEETHNLIDVEMISLMKSTSVLVNTSRGKIVDEEALYDALSNNKIAGAGFDVFAVEPLEKNSKLLSLDNIILTPHVSSQTIESLWRIYAMAIDISSDFFNGVESIHILNKDYKSIF